MPHRPHASTAPCPSAPPPKNWPFLRAGRGCLGAIMQSGGEQQGASSAPVHQPGRMASSCTGALARQLPSSFLAACYQACRSCQACRAVQRAPWAQALLPSTAPTAQLGARAGAAAYRWRPLSPWFTILYRGGIRPGSDAPVGSEGRWDDVCHISSHCWGCSCAMNATSTPHHS
jgi:hypothetical protein